MTQLDADELTLPIKRTEGETLEDRLTANAYNNILPARYLRKDQDGELVESQEDLFERVAKNIALAEAVHEAERRDTAVTVTPNQLKPDHPRRDELAAEVFGAGTTADDDAETELSTYNVNKFAYETVVPELPDDIREHVEETAAEFEELMATLSFIPNSPTLMNAGDELQQLSACFVDSPEDDLTDIHQTAKEAAEVFQCLTEDSTVMVEDKGIVSISEVEAGDRIAQRTDSGFQYKPVEETHTYEDADTLTVTLENGLSIRGTPNHRIEVDGEWTRFDEIQAGQEVQYALGWLWEAEREVPQLASVPGGAQWCENREVTNEEIVELYRDGFSDYEIAEQLDCGKSTVQRRRSQELQLPPNGDGGRKPGSTSFDESTAVDLYRERYTDTEIADELEIHQTTVGQFRAREQLAPNGTAVKSVQQPESLTEDLAELVGLWVGDGSWHQDGIRFHVGRESVAEYIDHLSRHLFGTATSSSFADGCYEIGINSHEIKRWWKANFDCKADGARSARVPRAIKSAPANVVEAFLRGYFTADGTLLDDTYPKLYSSSEQAIDDVATLLMGLGYPVKKSVFRDEDAHPYYGVVPTTGAGREAFLHDVGFIDERRELGLSNVESVTPRDSHTVGDDYTVAVDAVAESEPATVYDITVADNHEYVTDGIVSHNSGGGMGYAFWQLRPYGDPVGSTGGIASGPMTFMETFDQMCFPPGTDVLTPDGPRPIETLREGDVVVDENGDEQPVVETMQRQVDEELVEIVPERVNKPIRATGEHPFKVARGDGCEWVDAADLEPGDLLVLGHSTDENDLTLDRTVDLSELVSGPMVFADGGVMLNREYYGTSKGPVPSAIASDVPVSALATIAGWYLAEGCVVYRLGIPNEVTFTLHADEREEAAEITEALQAFDAPSRVEVVDDRNTLHVHVESASFAGFIDGLFGTGAAEKRVPSFLWNAPGETQARVLEALFDGDGTLETRGKGQRVKLQLTCEEVIDFVFQAGLRCGVQFSRHQRTPDDRKQTYWVSASVSAALGTPLERLFDDVPTDFSPRDRTKQVDGRQVVAIDSVERVSYDGPVYNAEVAGTHTYVAEDLVVHNCETIAQGGTRRGAQMGIMRVSHPDVIEFLHAKNKDVSLAHSLRLNDPDDYTYTSFSEALEEARDLIDEDGKVPKHLRNAVEGHLSNFNISVGVTDGFMDALYEGEEFTFTNPRTGEPHIATEETKEMYARYGLGDQVEVGEPLSMPAEVIWDRIVEGAHENGEPGVIYLERVNKQHSFDVEEHPDHRILATNPCLSGDMEVRLADGRTRPIQELAESEFRFDVLSREGGEITTKTAAAFKTKTDAAVVEVTTESGLSITVTPDHEIRTSDDGWVEARNLTAGDQLIAASKPLATSQGAEVEPTTEIVASIEPNGREDVYDLTVEDTHNFYASADGTDTINVHNCGEQPLEEYEACNLGHINLSTLAGLDAPDWRVWYDEHSDEYATLADAVDAFLEDAIDWSAFDERIELGTRFLENVVTMSDFPVPEIEQKVREMRKIGLGIMGLAQLYIQLGIRYGSEEGNEVARQLMTHINHRSKWTSHELAEQRGSFAEWDNSKYANPTEYADWFEHHTGLDAEEWADGFPIRNHNTTTIAPTGTTSMVGNTTGGCEPIYNVAYYKNVSDDVQGDEMLVEFDDYFLRVLEDNDIDVAEVKREAQEQMAANEFDGVEGLSTVPDAIGELFVVTGDLSGKEHAAVQCACQAGVDSAISKTCNFPNSASIEDMDEVYRYIYDHGGKGVTVYRDGTRSKQVLTTRADNAEFSDMDEDEAAEFLAERIEETFGGIEGFLDRPEVQSLLEDDLPDLLAVEAEDPYAAKQPRPDLLHGVTQRIDTGYGKLYVTINEDTERERPFELFATIGNSGGFTASFTEALAKTISTALRSGVDPQEIADELQGIRSPKVAWDKGEQINSIPDAIGVALRRYLDDEIDKPYPQQQSLADVAEAETAERETERGQPPEPDGGATVEDTSDDTQSLVAAGENPECPTCGSMSLNYSEGCKTCESCGWSEC